MILKKSLLIAFIMLMSTYTTTYAQHQIYDQAISLDQVAIGSDVIVKAKRISKQPLYYTDSNGDIHNAVEIQILEAYKGLLQEGDIIEYITDGGIIGNREEFPRMNGGIQAGNEYILLLRRSLEPSQTGKRETFEPTTPGYSHIMFTETKFSALYLGRQFKNRNDLFEYLNTNGIVIEYDRENPRNRLDPVSYRKQYRKSSKKVTVDHIRVNTLQEQKDIKRKKEDPEQFFLNKNGESKKGNFKKKTVEGEKSANTTENATTSTIRVAAGTGATLTLSGSGFGSSRGNIQLTSSDGGALLPGLDAIDFRSWTNTSIEFEIPSRVYEGLGSSAPPSVASGILRIITSDGDIIDVDDELDVPFSLDQHVEFFQGSPIEKENYYHARLVCDEGYGFTINDGLLNNSQALRLVEAALSDWSTYLFLDLHLIRDSNGNYVSRSLNNYVQDGENTIIWTGSATSSMSTIRHNRRECANSYTSTDLTSRSRLAQDEKDIVIANWISWDYAEKGEPVSSNDFYRAILHEIGHAVGLNHAINPDNFFNEPELQEIMFYAGSSSSLTGSQRTDLESGRTESINGAITLVNASNDVTWQCTEFTTILEKQFPCTEIAPLLRGFGSLNDFTFDRATEAVILYYDFSLNSVGIDIEYRLNGGSWQSFGSLDYGGVDVNTSFAITLQNLQTASTYSFRIRTRNTSGGVSDWRYFQDVTPDITTGPGDTFYVLGDEIIDPGQSVSYRGTFISYSGLEADDWEWQLVLFHNSGESVIKSKYTTSSYYIQNWNFSSPVAIPDQNWTRDQNGRILGELRLRMLDTGGYWNETSTPIKFGYKPTNPLILSSNQNGSTTSIEYYAAGASSYKIFYDNDSGEPYSGTYANEGASPINVGTTSFTLSNLSTFSDHYITVAAVNSFGESSKAEELVITNSAPEGATFSNPINVGTLSTGTNFTPSRNNHTSNGFGNTYDGPNNQVSDDIFYKFYVPVEGTVTLKTCSSIDTYLHMLNHQGYNITSNDNGYSCEAVASVGQSFGQNVLPLPNLQSSITVGNLSPRYYYAVVEGKLASAGLINLVIEFTPKSTDQNVVWEDFFRTSVSGTTISNTQTTSGWKSSAASANRIPANTDGHFEFVVPSPVRNRMIGFSENNYNDGTWRNHWETIQYNMYLRSNGNISIYHSASSEGSAGTYSAGDLIRIERVGSQIIYKVNGAVRYTSSCPYSKSLIIDFCLYTPDDFFEDVKTSAPPSMTALGHIPMATDVERIRKNAQPILQDSTASSMFSTLQVSPNPTRNWINLSMESEIATDISVLLYNDQTGKVVRNEIWKLKIGKNSKSLFMKELPLGTYIVEVEAAGANRQVRVLKF